MSLLHSAKILHLCHLSKPASDRAIYRMLCRKDFRKIVELGVGTGERAQRMLQVAATRTPINEIEYTGVDLFEMRTEADGPGLALKAAYQTLRATGAKIRLTPEQPLAGLERVANSLGKVDLLIFSAGLDLSQSRAWWFVPRLLHEDTKVCLETRLQNGQPALQWLERAEIEHLAAVQARRRAA